MHSSFAAASILANICCFMVKFSIIASITISAAETPLSKSVEVELDGM